MTIWRQSWTACSASWTLTTKAHNDPSQLGGVTSLETPHGY